ncbi:hypothetical protein ACFSKU_03560 [Pontibacter silvestris]|uniref:Uncharacterized protein n=1 Tax=Pontibacter silvestris TaxID=2305183 RepID=A0ABW4WVD3_9BACT|nr:hypothetical protein [Pontibacter silvestris]MCC9138762.1 hypothetical protein [Pontibacter silvestris]
MRKGTLNFWILLAVSVILSAIIIALFIKVLKLILYVILVLALVPVVYITLRLLFPDHKPGNDESETNA